MNSTIGNRIKTIREAKKLEPKYVAGEIDINVSSYSKIERIGTNSVATLVKIASALKVNVGELFEVDVNYAKENNSNYGFATKSDLEELTQLVKGIAKEMAKMREEMPSKRKPAKTYIKAKKK